MNKNILITSASISAVIGSACLMLSKTSERKKHNLKRHTGRAMHAMGDVADDITSILKSL